MTLSTSGLLAIIGSGELSDSMAEAHRSLMAQLPTPVKPVFIDTPAGFETNVDLIGQKAVAYFKRNFGLDLTVARYQSRDESPASLSTTLQAIRQANYLFAGPGSPSYAVNTWRDSLIWQAILERWHEGATLVFASAAALTLGRYTLPVYEIYKAGHAVHWIPGLDVLGALGLATAVVPHWNNASGEQHDTRFCFMGAARFEALEGQLPPGVLVVGVDEYSVLSVRDGGREARVLGAGQVTLRRDGHQVVHSRGDQFTLDPAEAARAKVAALPLLAQNGAANQRADQDEGVGDVLALRETVRAALERGEQDQALQGLIALSLMAGAGLEQGRLDRTERAVQSLQILLPRLALHAPAPEPTETPAEERDALLGLLVAQRAALRQAKQWVMADMIRSELASLGIVLEDTPTGTAWKLQNITNK